MTPNVGAIEAAATLAARLPADSEWSLTVLNYPGAVGASLTICVDDYRDTAALRAALGLDDWRRSDEGRYWQSYAEPGLEVYVCNRETRILLFGQ